MLPEKPVSHLGICESLSRRIPMSHTGVFGVLYIGSQRSQRLDQEARLTNRHGSVGIAVQDPEGGALDALSQRAVRVSRRGVRIRLIIDVSLFGAVLGSRNYAASDVDNRGELHRPVIRKP